MTAQPLTDEQLAAIQAREAAATPGPWAIEWDEDDVTDTPFPVSLGPIGYLEHRGKREQADAEFIAAARADVPALLAEVHRLRAELAASQAQLAGVWPCTCGHLQRQHDHDAVLGRDFCRSCPTDTDLHDYIPAPAKES